MTLADEVEALVRETNCGHSEARHLYVCADCLGPKITDLARRVGEMEARHMGAIDEAAELAER